MSCQKLRPLSGMCSTASVSTTWPSDDVEVSMIGAAADTVTSCSTAADLERRIDQGPLRNLQFDIQAR